MYKQKKIYEALARIIGVISAIALLVGCAEQPPPAENAPGFVAGLIHGYLALFGLIASIFTDVRMYAYPNSGVGYDIGFFLGIAAFLGGGGLFLRSDGTYSWRRARSWWGDRFLNK